MEKNVDKVSKPKGEKPGEESKDEVVENFLNGISDAAELVLQKRELDPADYKRSLGFDFVDIDRGRKEGRVDENDYEFLKNVLTVGQADPEAVRMVIRARHKLNNNIKMTQEEAENLLSVMKCKNFPLTSLDISGLTFYNLDLSFGVIGRDLVANRTVVNGTNYQWQTTVGGVNYQRGMRVNGNNFQMGMIVEGGDFSPEKRHSNKLFIANDQEGMIVEEGNVQKGMTVKGRNLQKEMEVGGDNSQSAMYVDGDNCQVGMTVRGNSYQFQMAIEGSNNQKGMEVVGDNDQEGMYVGFGKND